LASARPCDGLSRPTAVFPCGKAGRTRSCLSFDRHVNRCHWSGVVPLANDMGPLLVNLLLATFNGRSAKECAWFSGQHRANKYYT